MKKTSRRGFTLIELMVVMAIIAILAVLGLAALAGINTNNTLDRATEEIVGAIRESQNLAISVASEPNPSACPTCTAPLAWGITVNPDPAVKSVQPFYLDSTKAKQSYGEKLDYALLDSIEIDNTSRNFFYTTPFGRYYSTGALGATVAWSPNSDRPYDILPTGINSGRTDIKLTFKNKSKTIVIEPNGDVYAN